MCYCYLHQKRSHVSERERPCPSTANLAFCCLQPAYFPEASYGCMLKDLWWLWRHGWRSSLVTLETYNYVDGTNQILISNLTGTPQPECLHLLSSHASVTSGKHLTSPSHFHEASRSASMKEAVLLICLLRSSDYTLIMVTTDMKRPSPVTTY